MQYQIDYFSQGQLAWSDHSISNFDLAKDMATNAVRDGLAERTEIRGDDGRLQFHFPRVLRRA